MHVVARSISGFAIACSVILFGNAVAQVRPLSKAKAKAKAIAPAQHSSLNWGLGAANARVTLLEYGSLTCGGCAAFSNDILPIIKRRFIDTGQVRYVLRPFPTPPIDLSVAMHALALCAGPARYYPLSEAFFARQREVFTAAAGETGPKGTLFWIAEDIGGLSYSASEACLRDPARVAQVQIAASMGRDAGVIATPSFFINNVAVAAPAGQLITEERLVAAIEAALRVTQQSRLQTKTTNKAKKR